MQRQFSFFLYSSVRVSASYIPDWFFAVFDFEVSSSDFVHCQWCQAVLEYINDWKWQSKVSSAFRITRHVCSSDLCDDNHLKTKQSSLSSSNVCDIQNAAVRPNGNIGVFFKNVVNDQGTVRINNWENMNISYFWWNYFAGNPHTGAFIICVGCNLLHFIFKHMHLCICYQRQFLLL